MVLKKQLHLLDDLIAEGKLLEAINTFYDESATGNTGKRQQTRALLANVERINLTHIQR